MAHLQDRPSVIASSLDSGELAHVEAVAAELAWGAGRILLEHFQGPLQVQYKDAKRQRDPVTEADRRTEEYLRSELARRFPDHGIVGEEGAGEDSGAAALTWAVDPLDGTTNFMNRFPTFACSIALLERGVPVAGSLFIPWPGGAGGRVLHARKGGGAWDGQTTPLRVAEGAAPSPGRLAGVPAFWDRAYRRRGALRRSAGEVRALGSIAYEFSLIACGVFQYGLFGAPHVWDVAAGLLLLQEAGGLALVQEWGKKGWRPFTSFAPPGEVLLGQKELRQWRASIVAANGELAWTVARGLVRRRALLRGLLRKMRRMLPGRERTR